MHSFVQLQTINNPLRIQIYIPRKLHRPNTPRSLCIASHLLPSRRILRAGDVGLVDAVRSILSRSNLCGLLVVVIGTLVLDTYIINVTCGDVGECSGIAVVGVNACEVILAFAFKHNRSRETSSAIPASVRFRDSSDTIHDNMALIHRAAVSTAAVWLSRTLDDEVRDADCPTTVVLNNLIICAECSTALDISSRARVLLLDSESILADCRPPDVD